MSLTTEAPADDRPAAQVPDDVACRLVRVAFACRTVLIAVAILERLADGPATSRDFRDHLEGAFSYEVVRAVTRRLSRAGYIQAEWSDRTRGGMALTVWRRRWP